MCDMGLLTYSKLTFMLTLKSTTNFASNVIHEEVLESGFCSKIIVESLETLLLLINFRQ